MEEEKSFHNVFEKPEKKLRKMVIQHMPYNRRHISQKQADVILKIVKQKNSDGLTKKEFIEKAKQEHRNMDCHKFHYCPYCFIYMWKKKKINDYIAMVHEGKEKKYACKSCPKRFMSTNSLRYHTNVCHSETKAEVKCKVCDALFGHEVSLIRHMKKHEEIKEEIKCSICQKPFKRKDYLTKHIKSVHKLLFDNRTEQTLICMKKKNEFLDCKMCQKKFTGVDAEIDLETHIIKRCQEFKCINCQKYFSSKDSLKQHMYTHSDHQVELHCDQCSFHTKYKFNLKKHLKRQHSK